MRTAVVVEVAIGVREGINGGEVDEELEAEKEKAEKKAKKRREAKGVTEEMIADTGEDGEEEKGLHPESKLNSDETSSE